MKKASLALLETVGTSFAGGLMVAGFYLATFVEWISLTGLFIIIGIVAIGIGSITADVKRGLATGFLTSILAISVIEGILILPVLGIIGPTYTSRYIFLMVWENANYLIPLSIVISLCAMLGGIFGEEFFSHS